MRDMIPDANGEAVTIAAGDSVLKTRNFTISSSWPQDSCKAVVFLQNTRAGGDTIQQGGDLRVKAMTTGIEEEGGGVYPQNINLYLKSTNPFTRFIDIGYSVPIDEQVTLKVYNSSGQLVKTLIDGKVPHGYHTTKFDAQNLPNGVYLVMLRDKDAILSTKIILMR